MRFVLAFSSKKRICDNNGLDIHSVSHKRNCTLELYMGKCISCLSTIIVCQTLHRLIERQRCGSVSFISGHRFALCCSGSPGSPRLLQLSRCAVVGPSLCYHLSCFYLCVTFDFGFFCFLCFHPQLLESHSL